MKIKKVIWRVLTAIILTGCSVDDMEIIEEQIEVNAKNFAFLDPGDPIGPGNPIGSDDPIDPSDPVDPNDSDNPDNSGNIDLGMPVEAHSIHEQGILKIKFANGTHNFYKTIIRQGFSEKYPSLRLVLVTDPDVFYSPNIEYWLEKSNQNTISIDIEEDNIDAIDERDEDEELTDIPCTSCPDSNSNEYLDLINNIKLDIQSNDLIHLIN